MKTTMNFSTWAMIGALAGAAGCGGGEDGAPGEPGEAGAEGPAGPAGPAGETGMTGSQGAQGEQGPAGSAADGGLTGEEANQLRQLLNDEAEKACDDIELDPPADGEGIQLQMGAFFSAFYETEQCKFIKVPPGGLNFNGETIKYTPGSHHVLLWRTAYTEIPKELNDGTPLSVGEGDLFDCRNEHGGPSGLLDTAGVIAGSQNPDWAPDRFPSDTANPVEGGTYMVLNVHYLNPSPEGVHTCVKENLYTIPDADMKHTADTIFWYNPFITVPAQGQSAITARGTMPVDIELLGAVQSHMHERGASYTANLYDDKGDLVEELFSTTDWETPTPVDYDSPKLIPAGYSIEYTCNYNNAEDREVHQGLKTTDEMCMFIASYRTADEADFDEETHRYMSDLTKDVFFDQAELKTEGTDVCAQAVGCWVQNRCSADPDQEGCADEDDILSNAQQKCITDSCHPNLALGYLRCAGGSSGDCAASCQNQTSMLLYQSQCTTSCGSVQADALAACQDTALLADHQAKCSTDTPMAAYQAECQANTCSAQCGGDAGTLCSDCVSSCVTGKVSACVTEKVTACVTEKVTGCVTDCVTDKVTSCATECIQQIECKAQWDACAAATTCN